MTYSQLREEINKYSACDSHGYMCIECPNSPRKIMTAIDTYLEEKALEDRDSERNRIFAILRHLEVPHDAREISELYNQWHSKI